MAPIRLVGLLDGAGEFLRADFERTYRARDDGPGESAFLEIGRGRFIHLDPADEFRGQDGEIEAAAQCLTRRTECGRKRVTVELYQREIAGQAPDRDVFRFATEPRDLNAGDPLQRLGHVLSRELADVLRGDGVDNRVRVALGVDRVLQALTHTRDDDFLELAVGGAPLWHLLLRLRLRAGRHQYRADCRPQKQYSSHDAPLRPWSDSYTDLV